MALPFTSQAMEAERHLQSFMGIFAAPLRQQGLLQRGAVILLLWLPQGNGQLLPTFAALCGQSRSGEDTCAMLQDTPGMLKERPAPTGSGL